MPTRNPNESVRDMFTGRDQPALRCAVYTRQSVANAEQDLTSCDVQRERCENYVRAMKYEGWQLLDEHFGDLGVSGAELSRPGLDKLKRRLAVASSRHYRAATACHRARGLACWCVQGRVDIVVATRLDRLNRKMSHWIQLADWFKQAGIELVFVDGGTGARGPLADLVNNIVASFAEFRAASRSRPSDSHLRCSRPVSSLRSEAVVERDLLRERLLDAHARLRERGLRSAGRVPRGYKADFATRQLVIDEDEAAVVRAFFERCAARDSAASIARWANDAGHRTKSNRARLPVAGARRAVGAECAAFWGRQGGNRWSGRTVLQILRNPIYVGERVHAGGTVEGVHDGIIDADLAQRAWRAIEERRTRQPESRGPALDWDRDPYMLRGLLRCAGCGRVMTTSASARVQPSTPAGGRRAEGGRGACVSTRIDNADEVPAPARYARSRYCRPRSARLPKPFPGDAERPACTPSVQVSAQRVEAIVLAVLKTADPRTISDRRSCALLEHLRPSWDAWPRAERNRMVRDLVWSIRWSPRRGLAGFTLDTIAIDNFIEQGGDRFADLPPRRTPT